MSALRLLHRTCTGLNRLQALRFSLSTRPNFLHSRHLAPAPLFSCHRSQRRLFSTEAAQDETEEETTTPYHNIITDKERSKGPAVKKEFQAETRKLLDIVARSLYSEKEVFIRELVSNSNDALEKLRYMQTTGQSMSESDVPLEIHLQTDDVKKTFTIQDTGIGMTKLDLENNLGTIARSGSKDFLDNLSGTSSDDQSGSSIIGQFGVGFYASFMVAESVEVFTRHCEDSAPGYKWCSDGLGSYEVSEAEEVDRGTKVVLHLRGDAYDFAKEETIETVIKKYSNFVGVPIFLNGRRVNVVQPLWLKEQSQISEDEHEEFYRYISNAFDRPRYTIFYKTDAPLNIRALLYVPEYKPSLFEMSKENESAGVSLYCRKVMIQSQAQTILPKWLRFLRGVVDSEDIPLNLSRELLQDSQLIKKLNRVLTSRVIKYFLDNAKKDPAKYFEFYTDYGLFLKEGIVMTQEQDVREDIAKLLRFESSALPEGERTNLVEYADRMKAGSRNIFFLAAPNRTLAESSPYYEAVKKRDDMEVLFLYEPYDELVLMQLQQFDRKNLRSVENELTEQNKDSSPLDPDDPDCIGQDDADKLTQWMKEKLGVRAKEVKMTKNLSSSPCVISIREMGAVRHFLRTTLAEKSEEERFQLMEATLEVNPRHPVMKKLVTLHTNKPDLAAMIVYQLYDNALIQAGLMSDPRSMTTRMNDLITRVVEDI